MRSIERWRNNTKGAVRIVAFGSSNTELTFANEGKHNWVDWLYVSLRAHLGRHMHVINQGISGETAEMLLERIDRDAVSYRPAAVIVTIGGNDAIRGVPTEAYAEHLREVCRILREHGAEPILQTYYCPVYHQVNWEDFNRRFPANMQANRDLADELGLMLIDQYIRFEPLYRRHPDEYAKLMRDWMHVNHLGNWLMAQNICDRLGLPALPVPADWSPDADRLLALMDECAPRLQP